MGLFLPIAMAMCTCIALFTALHHVQPTRLIEWPRLGLSNSNADLVLYSFFETPEATKNFKFFLHHALHSRADFIIMVNGATTVDLSSLNELPNVQVVRRENRCFDLGGFREILSADPALLLRYKRYIFMNASLRGPFFPPWAKDTCWSDAYLDKLQDSPNGTKIVGMSWNCANGIPYPAHLQSMILAFDQGTLTEILLPKLMCYESMLSAVRDGETMISTWIREAGGEVFAMENRFVSHAGPDGRNSSAFLEWCVDSPSENAQGLTHGNDVLHTQFYEGTTMHPYETIFAKTNRDWDERDRQAIDLLTEHAEITGYSSYDHCR